MVFFRCWLSAYSSFTSWIRSLTWEIEQEGPSYPQAHFCLLGPRLLSKPPSITVTESQAA